MRESLGITPTRNRMKSARKPEMRALLQERDGNGCWLCRYELSFGEPEHPTACTLEHLWCHTKGGPNTMNNMVLCHFICNQALGDMSLIDKIKFRDIVQDICDNTRHLYTKSLTEYLEEVLALAKKKFNV